MRTAGFVLSGGQSSRMGRDKALLPRGSQTICEFIGDQLATVVPAVWLVGHPERYGGLKYPCVPDKRPDLGPLSGLETALNMGLDMNLVVSCDIWNLQTHWLQLLLQAGPESTHGAVLQDSSGRIQPLCGVYRKESLLVISQQLEVRRLRMMDLVDRLQMKLVQVNETILNINTPQEYEKLAHGLR